MGRVRATIIIGAAMAVVSAFSMQSLAQTISLELDLERLKQHAANCRNAKIENYSPGLDAGIKACEMTVVIVARYVDIGYPTQPQNIGPKPEMQRTLIGAAGTSAMKIATLELAKLGGSINPKTCLSTGKAIRIFEYLPAAESTAMKQSSFANALASKCKSTGLPLN